MYKVCRVDDGKYYSYVDNSHSIEYKIGEKTYPKLANSKLFLFSNLDDAKIFKRLNKVSFIKNTFFSTILDLVIFKCEAEDVEVDSPIDLISYFNFEDFAIESYWDKSKIKENFNMKNIDGCLTASSITLIHQV